MCLCLLAISELYMTGEPRVPLHTTLICTSCKLVQHYIAKPSVQPSIASCIVACNPTSEMAGNTLYIGVGEEVNGGSVCVSAWVCMCVCYKDNYRWNSALQRQGRASSWQQKLSNNSYKSQCLANVDSRHVV